MIFKCFFNIMFGVGIKFIDRVISKVRRFEKKYILEK